jgi:PAS domain S-box-containing protein
MDVLGVRPRAHLGAPPRVGAAPVAGQAGSGTDGAGWMSENRQTDAERRPEGVMERRPERQPPPAVPWPYDPAGEVVEELADGVVRFDVAWHFTYVNPAAERVLGRARRDLLGKVLWAEFPELEGTPFGRAYRRAMGERVAVAVDDYYPPFRSWFEARALPSAAGLIVLFRDASERRRAEAELARQSELLRTLADNADAALFVMNDRHECTFMNASAEAMTGFTFDEVRRAGRPLHDVIHYLRPDGRPYPMAECPIDRALPEQARQKGEDVFVHKSGRLYPVAFTASPIVEQERPIGTVIEVRETTEEKRAEAARLRHLRHRALAADVADAMVRGNDLRNALRGVAEALVEHLGVALAGVWTPCGPGNALELRAGAGQPADLDVGPARVPVGRSAIGLIAEGQRPYLTNDVANDPLIDDLDWAHRQGVAAFAGHPLLVGARLVGVMAVFSRQPLPDDALEALGSVADTVALGAERKRLEAALIEQGALTRAIIDHQPELAWTALPDGHIDFYNRRWYEYTGTSFEEMQGWGWQKVHDPGVLPKVVERWQHSLATGEPFEMEFPLRGADGAFRWFLTRVRPLRGPDGSIARWFGTNTDVDGQRRAAEERARLLESEREARRLVEEQKAMLDLIIGQSGDGIVMADEAGVIRVFNPAAEQQHGVPLRDVAASEWAGTYGLLALDGRPLALEETPLFKAVGGAPSKDARWLVRRPDGQLRTLVGTATPLRRPDGTPAGGVLVTRDETDRHRAEAERERLLRALAASNAELDQFAYVASHDLKAPLRGIANLSQWVEEDLGDALTGEARENMTLLRGRVHRLEALIDGILAYSRAGRVRAAPEPLDAAALLAEAVELLAPPPHVRVTIAGPMPTVEAERVPFQQVFMNLIGNAIKYGRRDGTEVRVGALDEGATWHFTVADNGPGIAPQYHERIWGIFQTLAARDDVEGTGIGLSVVKKIVETRGGRTWVESEEGRGATFHVLWPKRRPGASP